MLRREVREIIRGFTGQKSGVPFGVLQPGDATQLKNFTVRKGSLRKIWGAELYSQPVFALGSQGIRWIDRYLNRWFIQQGPVIAIETAENSASFTEVSTTIVTQGSGPSGVNEQLKIRSEKWKENIFLVNGKDSKRYYETSGAAGTFINLGLIPPGNGYAESSQPALSLTDTGGGGGPGAGAKSYLITWYDSNRNVESLPNGAIMDDDGIWFDNLPQTISSGSHPGDTDIQLDITAIKAAGYDTGRVTGWFAYRKAVADSVYRRVNSTAISIGTNTLTDSSTDAELGLVLDETISPPPDGTHYQTGSGTQGNDCLGPRFVKFFRNQLWLFGVSLPGNTSLDYFPIKSILYGSEIDNPDYYPYTFDVARSTQEEDTGLAEFRNTLHIFKTRSIHILDGSSPDNYIIRKIDNQRGCIAPGSIQETPFGIIALSSDGFVIVDGSGPARLISDFVFDEIEAINYDQLANITSGYDLKEGKYECHVPVGANVQNAKVFIYDVNEKTWSFKTKVVGAAVKYDLDSDNRSVGLLGDQNNSRLYTLTDTDYPTFNDQTILARYASKHYDFGAPDKLKRLDFITIKAKSRTDFVISIDVVMDFGAETISFEDISSQSVYSVWAASASDESGMTWDEDNWAGAYVDRKIELPLSGVARNFQIILREGQSSANRAGFQIDEIVLQGNLLKR